MMLHSVTISGRYITTQVTHSVQLHKILPHRDAYEKIMIGPYSLAQYGRKRVWFIGTP